MSTIEMIHSRLVDLATDAHQVACGLEIGKERTEASSYMKHFGDYSAKELLEKF